MTKHRVRTISTVLVIAGLAAAAGTSLPSRQVLADPSTDNNGVYADVARLESALEQLQSDFIDTQVDLAEAKDALADAQADLAEALVTIEDLVEAQQSTNDTLTAMAETLEYVSVVDGDINGLSGPHLMIEGCNVHVRSGSGATDDWEVPSGLGNLILGYNEIEYFAGNRGGAHNLVIGPDHTFSSVGGLVAGSGNTISDTGATVTGGVGNVASGRLASVTGGDNNEASGVASSVSGGEFNTASSASCVVSGGLENEAKGLTSVVSGGSFNLADAYSATVSGGSFNRALAEDATVSGGLRNVADEINEHVP